MLNKRRLKELLREQYTFIMNSGMSYDRGDRAEAKRLAIALRVLCHSGSGSTSLFSQLGYTDSSTFDSAVDMSKPVEQREGLWRFDRETSVFEAITTKAEFSTAFADWWEGPVYMTHGEHFTRKKFVFQSSNVEGGAHVDPDGRPLTPLVAQGTFFPAITNSSGVPLEDTSDPTPLALRTIAGEVYSTMSRMGF